MEQKESAEFEFYAVSLICKLLAVVISEENIIVSNRIPEADSDHITQILKYINQNYSRKITVTELASRFFLSEFYLCRKFEKLTGRSIVEYINYLRIEKAKHLLTSSSKEIQKIAKMCGFNTTAHFNHIFKEYEKATPSSYRKTYT